jgi:hypothetical protein
MELSIEEVVSEIRDQWMDINGVEGIGQGKVDDKDCILVFVSTKTQDIEKTIPSKFQNFPVKVMESGVIHIEKPQ